jgi:hypothetical protein
VWCYDFVFDACANGQQVKCLTVVDEFTRECLAIDVAGSIRSRRVIDVLSRLVSVHGAPRPEFCHLVRVFELEGFDQGLDGGRVGLHAEDMDMTCASISNFRFVDPPQGVSDLS